MYDTVGRAALDLGYWAGKDCTVGYQGWRWGLSGRALLALGAAVIVGLIGWGVTSPSRPMGGVGYGDGGMMSSGWGWMGAMMPVMLLAMLLFWVAMILGIVALVRWAAGLHWGRGQDHPMDALEIARRRYASGAITREEYERLRDELGRRSNSVA